MAADEEEFVPEAEVVGEGDPPATEAVPSTAVAHRPRRGEVLRPLPVADQSEAMKLYQEGLAQILDASDYQAAGGDRWFVKKSGWRKIATWFDLSIELVRDEVSRDEDGKIIRAAVWARAVAPSGRFADGDGYCDVGEFTGQRGQSTKMENDLRGTATTRATNRAISNLVGMGEVSSEETGAGGAALPYGPEADEAHVKASRAACATLVLGDVERARHLYKITRERIGYDAEAMTATLELAAGALQGAIAARREAQQTPAERADAARSEAEAATREEASDGE